MFRSTMTESLGPITLEKLRDAHRFVGSGRAIGKVVLDGF